MDYWEYPEIEDWDFEDRGDIDSRDDRCLPVVAVFIAATGPFVFCNPRRFCYPRGFCSPRSACRPYYFCRPRPCFPY